MCSGLILFSAVVLLSGTEEANYKKSGSKKKHIDKTMFERRSCFKLYEGKNRMVRRPVLNPWFFFKILFICVH